METEKVCVNLPAAELGKIDVLVAEGLYASRTDVIRSGIRSVLETHDETATVCVMPSIAASSVSSAVTSGPMMN